VTHVQATPSGWRLLLESGFDRPVDALCGGEALPLPLARELRGRVGRLWNVYGPTETTIWSTAWEVPADPAEVAIGRPIANTQAYVLDPRAEPVPVGVPGELYLGGAGLAEGYLGRPELTAARFVDLPFAGRVYRTGDLVRYTDDGQLTYLGRLDDQVKLRGYRIEPAEIEARLAEHPDVGAAAVVLRDEALVAYVTGTATAQRLRAHLAATLPDYMLPAAYVTLDRLPLTPNGKVDRRALPAAPTPDRPLEPARDTEAADEVTAQVGAICREVLRRDAIGTGDSLFDLGAHSLTMTAIAARIRRRMGADLPLHVFYDDPTVASIAAAARLAGPKPQPAQ
jgi:acyl-coenzyme A synthetase/AMP-(fatty) acid ligase